MRFVYHIFLLIIYFHILVHCQGGRGGGNSGGGGYRGGGIYSKSKASCKTHECRLRNGLLGVGFIALVSAVAMLRWLRQCCQKPIKSPSYQKMTVFANSTYKMITGQEVYDTNPFQSGRWSSRYFQYKKWHGPYQLPLTFSESMKVTGSGSDDVGEFTIDGLYSTETNQINLTKTYKLGTGNPLLNLGHEVQIQLIWNIQTRQFEGKWYVQTDNYHDTANFELKLYDAYITIESDGNGDFSFDSCYIEQLNGLITPEDYLYFVSKTEPLRKRLRTYQYLLNVCAGSAVFLEITVLAASIFWRIYFDMPAWTFFIVELIVPICIGGIICSHIRHKGKNIFEELKVVVQNMSNSYSKWSLEMDDSSRKIILHIEIDRSCQKDVITTTAPTVNSTPQLNTTTVIDIHEPISLCAARKDQCGSVASAVVTGLDEEDIASSDTALLPSPDKIVLTIQTQSKP